MGICTSAFSIFICIHFFMCTALEWFSDNGVESPTIPNMFASFLNFLVMPGLVEELWFRGVLLPEHDDHAPTYCCPPSCCEEAFELSHGDASDASERSPMLDRGRCGRSCLVCSVSRGYHPCNAWNS